MSSTIKVSIGSTVPLGLKNFKQNYPTPTIYLLTPGKCLRDCKYCSLSKSSNSEEKFLSRVVWPSFEINDVIQRILNNRDRIKRVCIQTVNNRFSKEIYTKILKEISDKVKVSISINTENDNLIKKIFSFGADRIGLALDIATEKNYEFLRGGDFFKKINFILKTGKIYEGRISTHIIVGLNETDFEILNLYKLFITNKINVGLFSFTPIKGTYLEKNMPPKLIRYRKIQIGTKLLEIGFELRDFKFKNNGEIVGFPKFNLEELIKLKPFNTRGCPDCNRPFYNERPTGEVYNYPFDLDKESILKEMVDLGLDKLFI
ncbi:MAG: radical SAM protein [Caldisericia bacterium]